VISSATRDCIVQLVAHSEQSFHTNTHTISGVLLIIVVFSSCYQDNYLTPINHPPSMSLFGQQPQQQQSSGLFGSTPAQGSSLFGQPQQQQQQSGGPFGQTQQQPQQQQAVSLFGQPHQQQTGGGGLFGQSTSQQPQQAGGLFNQSAQQPQQTGGLFGQTSQQLQQPQQQQGGLFGQSSATNRSAFGQQPPHSPEVCLAS
jgi:hypothetical protein